MKPKAWRWILLGMMLFLLVVVCVVNHRQSDKVRIVTPGEEAALAESLLSEKLSGPRYFNPLPGAVPEEGGPWIGVAAAMDQVPRIAAERKLGSGMTRKLELLIDRMSEPHPYRAVGGERIDLMRLNLSLDSLEK